MQPSETSRASSSAALASTRSEKAAKSPKLDMRSAPRARAYATASGERSAMSSTNSALASAPESGEVTAAPAGLTCLNDAAAGRSRAWRNSFTRAQAFIASHMLMKPGAPERTSRGRSPSAANMRARV